MTADSHLELFTGLFAWQQYTALWSLLAETGIWLIPFVVLLITSVVEARTRQKTQDAAAISLRNLEVKLVLALSVIVLAGQPTIPLSVETMTYKPPCEEFGMQGEPQSVRAGDTGTTYDDVYSEVLTDTTVPIWWYGVLSLSGGITHAAIAGIECAPDVSGLQVALDRNRVDDSTLMAEMQRFTEECYIPARSRFLNGSFAGGLAVGDRVLEIAETYGSDDVDWPGSRMFQEIPGLYDSIRARDSVRGFKYDPSRDYEPVYSDPIGAVPAGRPTCKEWWGDSANGLRKRVLDGSSEPGGWQGVLDDISDWWNDVPDAQTDDQLEDQLVRRTWDTSEAAAPADASFVNSYNREGWGDALPKTASAGGLTLFMVIFKPTMHAVRASAPMIQALTLLAIITLLPFAIVFSNYSWTMVGVGSLAIFTVKFWSYLWFLAKWAEDQLLRAMYPDTGSFLHSWGSFFTDGDYYEKSLLLEIVTGMMFMALPLIFSMIMAWAGFQGMGAVAAVGQSFGQKTEEGGGMGGRMASHRLGRGGKGGKG